MAPLALTPIERHLVAGSALAAGMTGCVAGAYALWWCIGAEEGELLGTVLLAVIGFAPAWAVAAAGARLAARLHDGWIDTRFLPRPSGVLVIAAPLVVATTAYDTLGPLEPWRWASLLPAISAALALGAIGSTLRRRLERRAGIRWSPSPRH